jgi:hypothetical protein
VRIRVYYQDTPSSRHMRRARALVEVTHGAQFVSMGATPGQTEKWLQYEVPEHKASGLKTQLRVAGFRTA